MEQPVVDHGLGGRIRVAGEPVFPLATGQGFVAEDLSPTIEDWLKRNEAVVTGFRRSRRPLGLHPLLMGIAESPGSASWPQRSEEFHQNRVSLSQDAAGKSSGRTRLLNLFGSFQEIRQFPTRKRSQHFHQRSLQQFRLVGHQHPGG